MKRFLPKQKGVFALLLALFAGMGTAYAYDFSATCSTGQTLYYNIIDATNRYVEITYPGTSTSNPWEGYTQPTGNITLPSTVTYNGNTYTVKRIGDYAFYTCSGLTGSLTIPNSVTTIGYRAFSDCSGFMGSLTIPNSVTTIGNHAFRDCSGFTGSLTISNSVTTIGHWTFLNCSGFTGSLIIPNSVTTIGMYAFENCSGFTGSLTIPNSVTSIGNDAFHGCSGFTGSLTISSSVTTIDYGTFWNCSGFTGSLIIPNSVTSIGMYAFRNCSGFTGSLTLGNSVTSIGMSAFQDCSGFTGNLTIPNSVTSISSDAFRNCSGFTGSLTIPNSVTSIGVEAFGNCSGFTGSLTLPNSVTSIGNYAFYNCTGFTGSLTLPNSVTSIGNYTFYNCTGFTGSLTLPNSVTSIGNYAFYNCTGFTGSLTLPNSVASIGNAAFRDCSGFTGTLTLPNSVTSIGNYAFYNCYGFTGTLTLPSSVTTIGDEAFRNCYGFTSMIVYPETPPTLGTYVFFGVPKTIPVTVPCGTLSAYQNFSGWNAFTNLREYCDPLTYSINADGVSVTVTGHVDGTAATGELIIPETKTINGVTYTVTAIGENAFNACSGFSGSLTIPNSVTTIGNYAFYGCIGLTGLLTLPNSVTTIGNYAFSNCSGFTGSLTLPNSVTTIGNYAFRNCSGFTGSLTLPNSVTAIGSYAFRGCTGFTGTLTLPNSVASIGNYAFANCSGFTGSLTFPNSVTSIGICAFYYCSGFTGMLTIPNSVTSIGHRAFYYCGGFTGPLTLPNSVTTIGNEAFHGCTGFTGSLTIGTGVISIGQGAFRYCAGFTSMTVYPQTPPTLGSEVFFYVPTTIPVYVLCSSMEDYQAASQWSAFTDMQCIQEALTVYDGSTLSYYLPAYIYYFDEFTKSQFVIPAADLADMTGTPISSMTFYTKGSNVPYTTVSSADVYLKEVNYTNISAFEPKASATTVYSGYLDIVSTDSGGEMTINFSTPYTYNGGNLLVGFENTEASEWKEISFYGKTVSGASVSGSNTSSLGSVQPTQQNFIPKTTFSYTPFACSRPISLAASKITSNSAMLQWTGYQDEYDLRYRKTDEWVLALSTNNQLLIDNLEPGTEYEWQVRGRDCEGSGTYTEWSATHSFTTKCVPLFVNAGNPFIEDFEGEDFAPACWENIPSGTYQWANATYQSHSSSHSAFSSWYGDIYLVLPDLELSADAESVQLSFWSYNIYPTDFAEGNNTVVLLNGNIETVLWSADEVSESWVKTTIDLTAYLGQTVSLAFKYAGDNGNGWFVDDVEVSVPVSTHWPDFNAEDYTFASQVFAFVQINEDYITEDNYEDKEIAAFVGDECRGHAYMYVFNYGDPYTIVELGICYDNSGEEVSFKLYDHAARREYDVCTPSFPVLTGEDHFELFFDDEEDLVLSFVSSNIQAIELSAGWNWFSTYIEVDDPLTMLQMVEAGLGENGIQIKNSRINTEYDEEWGWFGDLDEEGMTNEEMYKIFVNAPCTVTVEGIPANPENHPITINKGWNWIGFPSGVAISLEDAFAGFAIEGDKIKNRVTQIEYDPEWGWFGDFETLEPGQGYMYYSVSSTPRTLVFPADAK